MIFLTVAGLLICLVYIGQAADEKDFGPYDVIFEDYKICKGPKATNAAEVSSTMDQDAAGEYKATINITFSGTVTVDKVRMSLFSLKGKKKIPLFTQNMNRPCQHFVVAALIAQFTNNTHCLTRKGLYSAVINFTQTSLSFGSTFFYGEYFTKVLVASKKSNLLCMSFVSTFKRKSI